MRITSELINQTEHRQNPMGEHELILRELNIAEVENMGAAKIFERCANFVFSVMISNILSPHFY